ncbi:MAG: AAA family ATPase [Acidobacteria bacterium]|nr:AAA family ATPase [Acidobacteriota bacterium]MBI3487586.1 AAA family ATPase [Acidobacteriota bacterium]
MPEIPFKALKAATLAEGESLVRSWFPEGKREGDWWVCLNPTREDKKLGSFKVNLLDGGWLDFADSGAHGGDLVALYAAKFGLSQGEAAREVAQQVGITLQSVNGSGKKPAYGSKLGRHTTEWVYRGLDGEEICRVRRYDTPDGKEFRPLMVQGGKEIWQYPAEPRPLYGLDRLADANKGTVLVVEGEKAADAAARLFPSMAVVTSPAGAKAAKKADWTPLRGRQVVIWPDHDAPGLEYAAEVHAQLKALDVIARVVEVPSAWPAKFDLADPMPARVAPFTLQELIDQAQPWNGSATMAEAVTAKRLDSLRWSAIRGMAVPKVEWHWNPFFPKIPFGLLVSLPGHGKSILMVQIAVAIATGLPLFGFPTGTPGGVVIIALEDGKDTLHRRIKAAVESYDAAFTEEHHRLLDMNLRVLFRSENPLAYESPAAHDMALTGLMEEIIAEANTCEAPLQTTFIDTFNNVHGGDENSAQETRPIVAAIYALHTRLKCSVWALHHLKKAGTARNAPPIPERMDPDGSRGSGAILGAVRGQIQFGWIYPKEALKVGLEPDGAARRYAIMGLTKINDGPPTPWLLLEHTANAGLWAPVPNGAEVLARLRGSDAIEKATTADLVLMAVYEAQQCHRQIDRADVASKLFGDHKKPSGSLSTYLSRLVTDRLVTADKRGLTEAGLRRVKELLEADGGSDVA